MSELDRESAESVLAYCIERRDQLDAVIDWLRERYPQAAKLPGEPWHGTPGGYSNHLCRCQDCTDAWAIRCRVYHRRYREKKARGSYPMIDPQDVREAIGAPA